MFQHTCKMTFAAVALSVPLLAGAALPAAAAMTPGYVWAELTSIMRPMPMPVNPSVDVASAINMAEPGGYLAVLTQAQTDWLDEACTVALRTGSYSAGTVEFCHFLKDEIDVAEAERR